MTGLVTRCVVYRADLDAVDPDVSLAVLSTWEKRRADRFLRQSDHDRWVNSHAVMRQILGEKLQVPPACVALANSAMGQPYLPGNQFYISLSRSGPQALIALSSDCPVGVDMETRPLPGCLGAVRDMILCASEARALSHLSQDQQAIAFRRIWVRKEAILKATGLGLYDDPCGLDVGVDNQTTRAITHQGICYHLADLDLRETSCLAAAAKIALIEIRDFSQPARRESTRAVSVGHQS